MNRRHTLAIAVFPAILALSDAARASGAEPRLLTTAREVQGLSVAEARCANPVRLRGTVTYVHPDEGVLFVEDRTAGVFVFLGKSRANRPLHTGQNVVVEGVAAPADYAPSVTSARITVRGEGSLPQPRRLQFGQLLAGKEDAHWAEMDGVVRSGQIRKSGLSLNIATSGGTILGQMSIYPADWEHRLVDAKVSIHGVVAAIFNERRQSIGVRLFIPGFEYIHIDSPPPGDPFALPISPAVSVGQFHPGAEPDRRIRVRATVTGVESEGTIYVSDGEGSLAVQAAAAESVRPGDLIDVAGFPGAVAGRPGLQDAICRNAGPAATPQPPLVTPEDLLPPSIYTATGGNSLAAGMRFDMNLIQIEGILLQTSQGPEGRTFVLQAGKREFTATLAGSAAGSWRKFAEGSRLRITGVCLITYDQYRRAQFFRVLLRDQNEISVIARPAAWNLRLALWGLGLVAVSFFGALVWASLLRRQVSNQTLELRLANESLLWLSSQDALTGVANRRKFDERLSADFYRAEHRRTPLSILMADIDYFKTLNDVCGHQHGDECLRQVAKALQTVVPGNGDLVARYGGEEFAIILPAFDHGAALVLAEAIRAAVEQLAIEHPLTGKHLSISVGVATLERGQAGSPAWLIAMADKALYGAKMLGRNRVVSIEQLSRQNASQENSAVGIIALDNAVESVLIRDRL